MTQVTQSPVKRSRLGGVDAGAVLARLHSLPGSALFMPEEAAVYLNARLDLLRAWRSQRRGPPFVGQMHFVRYRKADLDAFMSGQARKTA